MACPGKQVVASDENCLLLFLAAFHELQRVSFVSHLAVAAELIAVWLVVQQHLETRPALSFDPQSHGFLTDAGQLLTQDGQTHQEAALEYVPVMMMMMMEELV